MRRERVRLGTFFSEDPNEQADAFAAERFIFDSDLGGADAYAAERFGSSTDVGKRASASFGQLCGVASVPPLHPAFDRSSE